eukprot:Rhum_TRINITY_DN13746_c2_g1::Rhum_TRINITY_DN13746_c2_g1_i1::g.63650::m.63650
MQSSSQRVHLRDRAHGHGGTTCSQQHSAEASKFRGKLHWHGVGKSDKYCTDATRKDDLRRLSVERQHAGHRSFDHGGLNVEQTLVRLRDRKPVRHIEDLGLKKLAQLDRLLRVRYGLPNGQLRRVHRRRQRHFHVVTGVPNHSPLLMLLQAFHRGLYVARLNDDLVADPDPTCLHPASHRRLHHVRDAEAERHVVDPPGHHGQPLQSLGQGGCLCLVGVPLKPCGVWVCGRVRLLDEVYPCETRGGYKHEVGLLEPRLQEEVCQAGNDGVVARLGETDGVELVHRNDDVGDACAAENVDGFLCLPALNPSLKLPRHRIHHKDGGVRLRRAETRVPLKSSVPGCVEHRYAAVAAAEEGCGNVHRHPAFPLLRSLVQHPGVVERRLADRLRLFLKLMDGALRNAPQVVQQVAHERALAGVNVSDDNDVQAVLARLGVRKGLGFPPLQMLQPRGRRQATGRKRCRPRSNRRGYCGCAALGRVGWRRSRACGRSVARKPRLSLRSWFKLDAGGGGGRSRSRCRRLRRRRRRRRRLRLRGCLRRDGDRHLARLFLRR